MTYDDDDARLLARRAHDNHHWRLTSDESQTLYVRTLQIARDIESDGCPHGCDLIAEVVPASGPHWYIEQHHAETCPLDDDEEGRSDA